MNDLKLRTIKKSHLSNAGGYLMVMMATLQNKYNLQKTNDWELFLDEMYEDGIISKNEYDEGVNLFPR